ncbi:MAG: integration host factor subunit beta [Fimbriiglobus sp.]|nr:integration host factor subunit beta [Fimbriiglobus sp.]
MTKKEIVKVIAEKYDQSQVLVKDIVQETFNLIIETLVKEGRIELRKFGVFEVKLRKARRARNPKTNDPVTVGPKKVVTFQPGKDMEERARHAEKVVEPRKKGSHEDEDDEDDDLVAGADGEELQPVGAGAEVPTEDDVPSAAPSKPR